MTKITTSEVRQAVGPKALNDHCDLAEDLSLPAIQRLVAQKLVEGMSEKDMDRLYFRRLGTSPSLAADRADLLNALCPTPDQGEG